MKKSLRRFISLVAVASLFLSSCEGVKSAFEGYCEPGFSANQDGAIAIGINGEIIGVDLNRVAKITGTQRDWTLELKQKRFFFDDGEYERRGTYEHATSDEEERDVPSRYYNGEYPGSIWSHHPSYFVCVDKYGNVHYKFDTEHNRKKYGGKEN